jgi:hypothetical protein
MKISKGPRQFFKVVGAKGRTLDWIRMNIPQQLRYYEDGAWYVHKKHIEEVQQLGEEIVGPTIIRFCTCARVLQWL